jgi:uncharacterized delta-60 repeat protein
MPVYLYTMATARPFAYNLGSPIPGTEQVGDLSIGSPISGFTNNPQYWNGPDEELGYVIAAPVSGNTQPTEIPGVFASVGFYRTDSFDDNQFIQLSEIISDVYGTPQTFLSASDASNWLTSNGFWNSFIPVIPTPTATSMPTPTPSITATQTQTPTNTITQTPTNTATQTQTPTPSITASQTQTPTVTPTQTPTSTGLITPVNYLIIGSGGGGGANWGGGGGAGQVLTGTTNFSANQTYNITISNGGSGAISVGQGGNGGSTTLIGSSISITSVGGGGGGYNVNPSSASNGSNGASGGGGGGGQLVRTSGGAASAGFNGGSVRINNSGSGGGGGSSQAGADGTSPGGVGTGGNGGNGTTSNITGSAVVYAGGGGGGGDTGAAAALGGTGGGGNGGNTSGGSGANATGYGSGGGGGATNNGPGGNGSRGVVILSIPTNQIGTYTGSPIVTTNGSNTVLTFTGNGSYISSSVAITTTPTNTPTQTPTNTPTNTETPTNTPTNTITQTPTNTVTPTNTSTTTNTPTPTPSTTPTPVTFYYIGGDFTSFTGATQNRLIRLNSDGSKDTSFDIGTGFSGGTVVPITLQSDGKILVGGNFTTYSGASQNRLIRLNSNGSKDTSFNIGTGFSGQVIPIALQSDGKVLAGGAFGFFTGTTQNRLIRLNSDGSKDTSFNIGTGFGGAGATTLSIVIQSDGKVLVGGVFTTFSGVSQNRLIRLNSDGSKDISFDIGTGFNNTVNSIALQSDGKVLVGGGFTTFTGTTQNRLIRLNSDGSKDTSFDIGTGFDINVTEIAIQSDGKILAGGGFTTYSGASQNRLIRLNSDGSKDTSFDIGTGFDNTVNSIALQSDGKVLVGGNFTTYSGSTQIRLIKLNSDGSKDTSFDIGSGFNQVVESVVIN